jgi:predicted DNA-binding helix-hairpin-helix protein
MLYNQCMDDIHRLKLLTNQMHLEPAEDSRPGCFTPKEEKSLFIHPAVLPNGQRIKLLKTLLTSACEQDCAYCPFRAGRDMRRATFTPEAFAGLFMKLHHAGAVEGMFLSSGVTGGGIRTQDKLLDTAEILRQKFHFQGYLHLKIMPGSQKGQVERAMQLADRLSVNLEAPNPNRLSRLAPGKNFLEQLLEPLKWVDEIRNTQPEHYGWKGRWPSTVTQFVVGGADESDLELLTTTDWLQRNVHLKRAYFSAFTPIADTPLENRRPTDPLREHRLYQASYLLRDYGFNLEDLPFTRTGNLPLPIDPKQAWAQQNLTERPVDVNRADIQELLRVPGIGPKGANAILQARKHTGLSDLSGLKRLGVLTERAAPYILLNGRRAPVQLALPV